MKFFLVNNLCLHEEKKKLTSYSVGHPSKAPQNNSHPFTPRLPDIKYLLDVKTDRPQDNSRWHQCLTPHTQQKGHPDENCQT